MRNSDNLYYSVQPTRKKQKFKPVTTSSVGVATEQVWGDTKSDGQAWRLSHPRDYYLPKGTPSFVCQS